MKNVRKLLLFLLIAIAVSAVSCNSAKIFSKKSNCGCPSKKGMVGY
jgi:hypothetical protein